MGPAAISSEAARRLQLDVSSELQQGRDRSTERRDEREAKKSEAIAEAQTFEVALRDYVASKRRKDGLPLKARTKADYIGMIEPGGTKKNGAPLADGELLPLAQRPISKITAAEIREAYKTVMLRGERRAAYAMQVLRAVFNWHGVKVPGNPLSKEVAGRDRIVLRQSAGKPNPIPPEKLARWWQAACEMGKRPRGNQVAADYYRFRLLTGTRGVEVLGDDFDNLPILVRDLDPTGARIRLPDTKNRKDHILLLSRQALEIAVRNAEDKKPEDKLFAITTPRKTLLAINAQAEVQVSGHDLRDTFISVAEELVSAYTVKRMVNHTNSGDVTGSHYIGKSEAQLRAGWQAVADFLDPPKPTLILSA